MKHKNKLRLARRISSKQKNAFISPEWEARKEAIAKRVAKREGKHEK
jgi:hypothetical protein